MKLIVCVDDNYGLSFNDRRVSKDSEVIKDIVNNYTDLCIKSYSHNLFLFYDISSSYKIKEYEDNESYWFVEDNELSFNDADELVIYYWNRKYPSDVKADINTDLFNLVEEKDFVGSSHKLITKRVYRSKNEEVKEK